MKTKDIVITPLFFIGGVIGAGILFGIVISIAIATMFGLHTAVQYFFGPF